MGENPIVFCFFFLAREKERHETRHLIGRPVRGPPTNQRSRFQSSCSRPRQSRIWILSNKKKRKEICFFLFSQIFEYFFFIFVLFGFSSSFSRFAVVAIVMDSFSFFFTVSNVCVSFFFVA